jgi:DNA-binding transcriptional LysR family regulator
MVDHKCSARVDWEDLRVLVELARQGSLSATARALGVTHVTVSRRIANLECDLDQPLFTRESGRYVLTAAGKRILDLAIPMAEKAEAILRTASSLQDTLSGPVRVTATEAVGIYIVMPGLRDIRLRYPDIDLDVRISQVNLNLARSDTDIAVRLARPEPDKGIASVQVAELAYQVYGSRSYVHGHKPDQFEYIGYSLEYSDWPEAQALDRFASGARTAVRIDHLSNRIEATRLGLGLALIPGVMARSWPDLVRVSRGPAILRRQVYVLVHEDLKDVPRFKACVETLVETIGNRFTDND